MKIAFFLQYDSLGPSSLYRILIYRKMFDKKYHTHYYKFWNNRYVGKYMSNKRKYIVPIGISYIINVLVRIFQIIFIIPFYDVLMMQRCVFPGISSKLFLRYLKLFHVRLILDVDDAIHIDKTYDSDSIAALSDAVIVGSHFLYDHYITVTDKVYLVPTVDNDEKYTKFHQNTYEKKCIGWIGSFSTISNLDIVVDAVNKVIDRHPETYIKIIADAAYGYDKRFTNCKFVKWSEETYVSEMSEFTVGIMPLFDTENNKGKCGFKLIEYLDMKKPVIATDLGENKYITKNYGTICKEKDEWYEALEQMLFNSELYNECIENIQNDFLKDYGYTQNYKKIEKIILACQSGG